MPSDEPEDADTLLRGLIITPEHAPKFFESHEGKLKSMELRGHNLRCVQPRGRFWIVQCGEGRNSAGTLVYRLLGSVQFMENVSLDKSAVQALYASHLCPQDKFEKLSAGWQKVVGWRLCNPMKLCQPTWFKPGSQDISLHQQQGSSGRRGVWPAFSL